MSQQSCRRRLSAVLLYSRHRSCLRVRLESVGVDVVFGSIFGSAETFFFDPSENLQG